jgi:hypothetical protein
MDCKPNEPLCQGDVLVACNADGTIGKTVKTCDASNNQKCMNGACVSPCDTAAATHSYIGCDYWAATLLNAQLDARFDFAIAVANPLQVSDVVTNPNAEVVVTRSGAEQARATVAPGEVKTINLPWVPELSQNGQFDAEQSVQSLAGGYHIVSTMPVTVYQFNPLEYEIMVQPGEKCSSPNDVPPLCHSYSNDASILLPTTALQKDYIVAARQTYALLTTPNFFNPRPQPTSTPGYFAVVATVDNTNVTVTYSAYTAGGTNLDQQKPGDVQTYSLSQGDVLQIISRKDRPKTWTPGSPPPAPCVAMTQDTQGTYCDLGKSYDLTGTRITADHPVEVFGGHSCSFVPYNKWACDHLEEVIFPLDTWGKEVLGVQTPPQTVGEVNYWRVISGVDGNMITFDPPVTPTAMLDTGQWIEFAASDGFHVKGTGRLMVAQYMEGENAIDLSLGVGDPSIGLAVPVEQYRKNYDFLNPGTYMTSTITIMGPTGASITLDQQVMTIDPNNQVIGNSGFGFLWIDLMAGAHHVSSDMPFGIAVSGIAPYTSYLYPGGLNLNELAPQ